MAIKVGINGFGRIGRNVLRASLGEGTAVAAIGITDQRASTILWDRQSGAPVGVYGISLGGYNAALLASHHGTFFQAVQAVLNKRAPGEARR